MVPVTYIAFTEKSPLPAPDCDDGTNATHSKSPPPFVARNATVVRTGSGEVPPVPPSIIVLPAPHAPPLELAAKELWNGLAAIATRIMIAIPDNMRIGCNDRIEYFPLAIGIYFSST
jgi:hypothetical protein